MHADSKVVPCVALILKVRWDEAASMAVMKIELQCGEFKVTSPEYSGTDVASATLSSWLE
jgi:hypothetical protein